MNAATKGPYTIIIDDDKGLQKVLGAFLKRSNIEGQATGTGEEALELLERIHVDVVICDACLPGISGEDLVKKIKSLRPGIQVIMISGFTSNQLESPIDKALYCAWLQKPFSCNILISEIQNAFASISTPEFHEQPS